ncbi:swr1 complex component, partial [Tulasnella sp. 403]
MDTPGAGPSGLRDGAKEPLRFNLSSKETIEKKKEDMLLQRRQDLTKILDLHDDLVREAFHLEKFVTLVSYDPKVAKDDKSAVFEEYRRKYDLLAHTKQGGSKGRKTRGTTQGFRDQLGNLITSPSPAPSTSKSYFIKGKGKGGPSPANPTEFGSPPSRRLTLHATPTSLRTPSKRKPPPNPHPPSLSPTPTRIRIIRPPATPKFPVAATFTPHRTLRHARLLESPQNDSSRTWEPTVFTPKHRASASPTESPRMLKRIKLVHRPKLEYSDPTQIPPRPQHSYSLSSLLDSYYFLDDETVVSSGELDAIAECEARKRNKIARLRETGVFENHERKLDTTPPDEPKRQLDHRDHLVAHAVSVGKAIRENLKARQAGAKRIAKMVEKHFEKVAGADTKEQKAEEKRRQLLVKFVLKEVVKEWKLAVAVIRSRKKEELKAEQMRRGKEHLDAFLQQSTQVLEAQHSELVSSSFAKRPSASRSSKSRASSFARSLSVASSLRLSLLEPCDTTTPLEPSSVVHVNNGGLTESEEEAESMIVGVTDSDDDGELHLRVSSPPPEEELPSVENGSLSAGHANTSHEPVNEIEVVNAPAEPPETPPRRSSSHGLNGLNGPENGFDVFQYRDDEQIDILDRQFDAEMEEEEGADERSDDSELDGLQKDVDVPIEEILRQYGYIIPNQASPAATADNLSVASSSRPQTPDAPRDLPPEPIDNPVALLDDGFQAGDLPALDDDDHRLEMEMEAEEGDESDDAELNGLEQDAEVSIEELLRRYGYAMNNQEDVDDHPTANGVVKDALERKELVTVVQPSPGSPLDVEMKDEIAVEVATSRSRTPTPSPAASLLDEEESVEDPDDEDASDAETSGSVRELSVGENGLSMKVPPPFLLRGTLRPYQQAGLEWLASLHSNDTNGILADEMGLGKTIQTIALLGYLACSKGIWGPHLIIVPTSVLLNWEMEFKKFLPGFRTLSYYGTQKERKEKRQGWTSQHAFNVCITSYQLALADHQIFRRKKWVYMILDEAHNIKNFKSKRWETLLCFNAQHRLLLTGTPLQNNLMELWSLLYFLMPDEGFARDTDDAQLFVRRQDFKDLFQNPVERAIESGQGMTDETRDTVQKLHTLLRPYLLRRLKSEVEQQLPAKHEHIVYCRLSKRQRFLYDEFMSRAATKETLASGNFLSIVNCLMQLRKVCNHPNLFEVRPISTSFAMPRSAVADYEIKELLVRRRLLNSDPLNDLDLGFLGLHIARYQPNSEIVERSTRSLTGADTVIFYDSDYNPSMDRQCEDRAHRIGQMREVHIYRFISSHTVEEAMLRKANQKRSLDDMVIQKGEFDWRKMLADELDGGSGGRKLEEALAVVEDKEDAEAARVAAAEFNLDATEFNENTPADRAEGLGVDLDAQRGDADEEGAEEGPEDDGIGTNISPDMPLDSPSATTIVLSPRLPLTADALQNLSSTPTKTGVLRKYIQSQEVLRGFYARQGPIDFASFTRDGDSLDSHGPSLSTAKEVPFPKEHVSAFASPILKPRNAIDVPSTGPTACDDIQPSIVVRPITEVPHPPDMLPTLVVGDTAMCSPTKKGKENSIQKSMEISESIGKHPIKARLSEEQIQRTSELEHAQRLKERRERRRAKREIQKPPPPPPSTSSSSEESSPRKTRHRTKKKVEKRKKKSIGLSGLTLMNNFSAENVGKNRLT